MLAHKRILRMLLPAMLAAWLSGPVSARAERVASIDATLILASNDASAQDPRLEKVEYKLRRIFGFEYYKHLGEGTGMVNLPGGTTIGLGHGCRLEISASDAGGGRVRASVQWIRDENVALNTTVVMSRGTPVILGGISHAGGTLIVTLVAR